MRKQSTRQAETTERIIEHHTTPEQAGKLFAVTRPKLAVFSHIVGPPNCENELISGTRKNYDGAFEVGHDLMAIEVGDEVTIRSKAL